MTFLEYLLLAVIVFGSALLGACIALRIQILHFHMIAEQQKVPCPLLEPPEEEE